MQENIIDVKALASTANSGTGPSTVCAWLHQPGSLPQYEPSAAPTTPDIGECHLELSVIEEVSCDAGAQNTPESICITMASKETISAYFDAAVGPLGLQI